LICTMKPFCDVWRHAHVVHIGVYLPFTSDFSPAAGPE
jgi:hypothetical protein